MRPNLLCLSALLLLTLACFWPVGRFGFIGYDDIDYVYQNEHVQAGLTPEGIAWAFTTACAGNWHPLTWLSHMVDCDLFGLNPHASHWINLGCHAANSLLVFIWLHGLTGRRGRSFLVAALFAVHPLHVQSVAWISERKDVLSGLFCLGTLIAYTRYCRDRTTRNYLLVAGLFALGLMAKPMLVTLPLILLVLDFWPLARNPFPPGPDSKMKDWLRRWPSLVAEKIPLFLLALASGAATLWAQRSGGAVIPLGAVDWPARFENALAGYGLYLEKMFWPADLAIFYPLPLHGPGPALVGASSVLLMALFSAGIWQLRRRPYLFTGWLWFFIMLLPVIGILQVGAQAMADRYTYLPSIGLFMLVIWAVTELAPAPAPMIRLVQTGAGAVLVLACAWDTRYQLQFWRDNITLFKHVVAVTPGNNAQGYFYLGISYGENGDLPSAANALSQAVESMPDFDLARNKLGNVLLLQKKYSAAEPHLAAVSRAHPDYLRAHVSLGLCLAGEKKFQAARSEYLAARQLQPDDAGIDQLLKDIAPMVEAEQKLVTLTDRLKTNPTAETCLELARTQALLGNCPETILNYKKALAVDPDLVDALNDLAWLLATCPDEKIRDGTQAVTFAQHACELTKFEKTIFLGTLGAAYAEAGNFANATATAQRACDLAAKNGETELLRRNQELLVLYQNHQAYHEK
ncbi:MAG: tetratricopeptide repeat protein [Verrucomicrobiae bacterium]|nr:tetratricopeptide repeat protein [Verrucomicrobiae bacterium]